MNCPTDGETLLMSERMGVEIDYCPRCRGIWLDRGELDKLLRVADRDDEDRRDDGTTVIATATGTGTGTAAGHPTAGGARRSPS